MKRYRRRGDKALRQGKIFQNRQKGEGRGGEERGDTLRECLLSGREREQMQRRIQEESLSRDLVWGHFNNDKAEETVNKEGLAS